MASTIIMPQLGETVAEGKILAWFKAVGDEIKEGDNAQRWLGEEGRAMALTL